MILGMPWNSQLKPRTNYDEHIVSLCDGTQLIANSARIRALLCNKIQVLSIIVNKFRQTLRRKYLVELYCVVLKNHKVRKSQREDRTKETERKLNGNDEGKTEDASEGLKKRHENDPELRRILEENRSVFRTSLPLGFRPNGKETIESIWKRDQSHRLNDCITFHYRN